MHVKKVDHIAIVVKDMDNMLRIFTEVFNLSVAKRTEFPQYGIHVAFVRLGELQFEVIQPTVSSSPFARHLAEKGEGLHHLALEVDDIEVALEAARKANLKLEDEVPKPGADGPIAYLSPETSCGVYLQFVQKGK